MKMSNTERSTLPRSCITFVAIHVLATYQRLSTDKILAVKNKDYVNFAMCVVELQKITQNKKIIL